MNWGNRVCHACADQRNLGMSMRVERSSLDQVKKRFEVNKKKLEEKQKEYDFEERMKELREEVRPLWERMVPADGLRSVGCRFCSLCGFTASVRRRKPRLTRRRSRRRGSVGRRTTWTLRRTTRWPR